MGSYRKKHELARASTPGQEQATAIGTGIAPERVSSLAGPHNPTLYANT